MGTEDKSLEIKDRKSGRIIHRTLGLTLLLALMLSLSIYGSVLFAATVPENLPEEKISRVAVIDASDEIRLKVLNKEVESNDECLRCHSEMKELFEKSSHGSVTGNVGKGLCLNCHTPHRDNFKSELRNDPILLCKDCHKQGDTKFNHPIGKLIKDENKESELTCTSTCHNPHGSNIYAMLRDVPDSLCIKCHQSGELW